MATFNNLPGTKVDKIDGNLSFNVVNNDPIVLVLGTAAEGISENVYNVTRVKDAVAEFGKSGTLVRGMYEVNNGGAQNISLYRIGATPAVLSGIGGALTITTVSKDDSAGTDYKLAYVASTGRLYVYRASDDVLVYDNYPTVPAEKVDLGEVSVTGTISSLPAGTNIGSTTTPITLADADGVGGASYTAGTDNATGLSRMEIYENLYNAYELLEDVNADVIVPMDVYLDDANVADLTPYQVVSGLELTSLTDYPTGGTDTDVLGMLYTEEYEGENYFWWWFPADPVEPAFTGVTDGGISNVTPQLYPSVGLATATTKIDGTALTADDFHEVNFAYQLANFCYNSAKYVHDMTGVIGVKPPASNSLKDIANWAGKSPVTTLDGNGNTIIATNGTGLLGNKFMVGRVASGSFSTRLGTYSVDGIAATAYGGFPATGTGWLDSTHLRDDNDHLIDIGKYLSIVAAPVIITNAIQSQPYQTTYAPTYAGFYSALPPTSAPTNKNAGNVVLPFRLSKAKLDALTQYRYVTLAAKPQGIVIVDAPSAARPDSDYTRLSTMRQVKAVTDAIRAVGERFIGEGMTDQQIQALDTAILGALKGLIKGRVISAAQHKVITTPIFKVQGKALVELKIVPAFELRQIDVTVSLAATL